MQQSRDFLSTCVGVSFNPPKLLEDLATREKDMALQGKQVILKGDEKAGLRSIAMGRREALGASNLFVGAQRISVGVSRHVLVPTSSQDTSDSQEWTVRSLMEQKQCESVSEETFYFYSRNELSLGQAIHRWVGEVDEVCSAENCSYNRGDHTLRYVHGGTRVEVQVQADSLETFTETGDIYVWESCVCCNVAHDRKRMTHASS